MNPFFSFNFDFPLDQSFGVFYGVYAVIMLILSFVSIGVYVLVAVGMMNMAKKCGIKNGWMSFIPVANLYLMGCLAEQYDDGKQKTTRYSRVLLGLGIAVYALSFATMIILIVFAISFGFALASVDDLTGPVPAGIIAELAVLVLFAVALFVLAIILCVYEYIALYRIYAVFSPDYAVLFLVLSIFVGYAYPVVVFVLSFKQPRRIKMPYNTVYNPPYTNRA